MYATKFALKSKRMPIQPENTIDLLNPIIIMGQCFALLPVKISKAKNSYSFKFKWVSIRVLYTLIVFIAALTVATMCFYEILIDGVSLAKAVDAGFYTNAVAAVALFTILARDWGRLMNMWIEVDKTMNRVYGFPNCLRRKVIQTTSYFMLLAAVEHLLSLTFRILDCGKFNNCTTISYYENNYHQVFSVVNYSAIGAIVTQLIHFWCTFAWNYNNLFIMLMSTVLAERFKQITTRLRSYEKFKFADNFWSTIREDYDKLCYLCYELDSSLSYIILSSYGTNLFFIIIQLYNSLMNNYRNIIEKAYFFFSFAFLIFRTVAVSLYAAQINDASKEPIVTLHSVPSQTYNEEIKRFLCQISFDSAVLTGCKMFKITRGLILNIAGAIVTYELVLIQFNANPYTASV